MTSLILPSQGGLPLVETFTYSGSQQTWAEDYSLSGYSEFRIEYEVSVDHTSVGQYTGAEFYLLNGISGTIFAGATSYYDNGTNQTRTYQTNRMLLGRYVTEQNPDFDNVNFWRFTAKRSTLNTNLGYLEYQGIYALTTGTPQSFFAYGQAAIEDWSNITRIQVTSGNVNRDINVGSIMRVYAKA